MKSINSYILTLGMLCLGALEAVAATYPRLSAEQLTTESQVIIEGNVVRSWASWDSEHKYIWTHYELSITGQIRGSRGATMTISEPGGTLDGVNQQFSGVVSYIPGESAVLFLYQTPIGYWRSVGGPQGKFTVDTEGRVHANTQAGSFLETATSAAGTSLSTWEGLSVRDFKDRVQRLAATHPFRGQR